MTTLRSYVGSMSPHGGPYDAIMTFFALYMALCGWYAPRMDLGYIYIYIYACLGFTKSLSSSNYPLGGASPSLLVQF